MERKRFKINDSVMTEYGAGIIVGVDLTESELWRFIVQITEPIKSHFLINQGRPLCFFEDQIILKKVLTE